MTAHTCIRYNLWLGDPQLRAAQQPEWILRFGAFPVTRNLQNYLVGGAPIHILVEPWPRWSDPAHQLTHLLRANATTVCQAILATAPTAAPADCLKGFMDNESVPQPENAAISYISVLLDELPANTPLFVGNLPGHSATGQCFRQR